MHHIVSRSSHWRRATTVALVALVATLMPFAEPPADATHDLPPAVNGPIAFVANHDIWYRSADGTFQQVTQGQLSPAWDLELSPDGRRIAFSIPSAYGLWVVNVNGTNLRNVLQGYSEVPLRGYDPSWDPSGHKLAFTSFSQETKNNELFTVDVDQPESLERLTDFGAGVTSVPVWNPVAGTNEIAYIPCISICQNDIKIINTVTGHERLVSGQDAPPAMNIDWSPDGTTLAVEAYSDSRLYTVKTDGTGWKHLDPNDTNVGEEAPSWSPDGTQIAFKSYDPATGTSGIMTVNAVTGVPGGVSRLTADLPPSEYSPSWGPVCVEQCIGTALTAKRTMRPAKITIRGVLQPGLVGETVRVTLYKRKRGNWVPLATKAPITVAEGKYVASFPRPASGKCGVLAEFTATDDHMASHKAIPPFDC